MNIVVDKLLTSYELQGRGKLVLLLHGWGDSSKGLAAIEEALVKKYQVLSLDLPGFGGSQAPPHAWNLDDYANFVHATLLKLDLQQPYAAIGHSNGGALAVRATALGLLKPKKLVLLAAAGHRTGHSGRRFILKVLAKTGNAATIWMPERYRQALRQSLYTTAGSDLLVVPGMEESFKLVVRQDVQSDAVMLNVVTLLIYASDDEAVPLKHGQRFHELIKGSKLEVIDGGHFVHCSQPEKVNKLIMDFLA